MLVVKSLSFPFVFLVCIQTVILLVTTFILKQEKPTKTYIKKVVIQYLKAHFMFVYYRNSVANSDLERGAGGNTSVERDVYGKNLSLKEKHIGLSFKLIADGS